MEFHGVRSAPISITWPVPSNSKWAIFADPSSSMEFHGTWSVQISLTSSSKEFHGISWNLECANFALPSSAHISMARVVPWNSLELVVRQFRWQQQFHGIPWNFKRANFAETRRSIDFHGIPWNLERANFEDPSRTMEFHGILWYSKCAKFRWHEQFHEIPWNLECAKMLMARAVQWHSMELVVREFRWHQQFHGIPWNLLSANFADTSSSMKFHGIPWNWGALISMTRAVPWNSMELEVRQFRWQKHLHRIPWNSMELGVRHFRCLE